MCRWLLLLCLLVPASAAAQVVELGGGVSRGCDGDSSGFCGDNAGAMWAGHASLWLSDRWEVGGRIATLPLPDFSFVTHRDDRFDLSPDPVIRQVPRIDISTSGNSRRILSAEVMHHFGTNGRLGAMLGLGIGTLSQRSTTACAPAGCEGLLALLGQPVGQQSHSVGNLTMIAGVSGRVHQRLQLRGGVRLHNFAGENNSTTEVFLTAGFRFGR